MATTCMRRRRIAMPGAGGMPIRSAAFGVCAATTLAFIAPLASAQPSDTAKPLALSIGTVKDRFESSIVRALVKYSNAFARDEALRKPESPSFYIVNRKMEFDVTDKGTFAGVSLRYGATRFSVGDTVVDGVAVTNSAGWIHTIPMTLGLDADRGLANRDVLIEVGYVPFKGSSLASCFKLGGNPIVGIVGQAGHRSRKEPEADFRPSLARLKLEAKASFPIGPCLGLGKTDSTKKASGFIDVLAADIAAWHVMIDANSTRDFIDKKTYTYAAFTLRVPASKDSFVDLRRESGALAPTYTKGSQYGVYLTVQY